MQAGLKNTPQSSLLMSTFEGRQITQLICPKPKPTLSGEDDSEAARSGVGREESVGEPGGGNEGNGDVVDEEGFDTRERGEAFMCISLEVKNMVGVEDALEKFTEKEIIEGYAWDDEVGQRPNTGVQGSRKSHTGRELRSDRSIAPQRSNHAWFARYAAFPSEAGGLN